MLCVVDGFTEDTQKRGLTTTCGASSCLAAQRRGLTVDPTSVAESAVTAACLVDRMDRASATHLEQPTEDSKGHEENTIPQLGHPINFASQSGETQTKEGKLLAGQ